MRVCRYNKISSSGLLFITIAALFVSGSFFAENRSFFFSYSFIATFIYCSYYRKISIIRLSTVIFAFFILLIGLITLVKVDSTSGRLLIYKLSFELLKDSFPGGIGVGNYGAEIGTYQVEYFKRGDYTQKELLLADNVGHAYNDYLELFIELGLLGGFIILSTLFFLTWLIYVNIYKSKTFHIFQSFCLLQLGSILTAANFTFVFARPVFQVVFFLSITVLIYYGKLITSICHIRGFFLTFFFVFLVVQKPRIAKALAKRDLVLINEYYKAGYFEEAVKVCKSLEYFLGNDPEYLWIYANSQLENGDIKSAINITQNLLKQQNNQLVYGLLARSYLKDRNLAAAESAMIDAINKVPNRFVPRYQLFLFYADQGLFEKAERERRNILHLPIKVHSHTIDEIKQSVLTYQLNKY